MDDPDRLLHTGSDGLTPPAGLLVYGDWVSGRQATSATKYTRESCASPHSLDTNGVILFFIHVKSYVFLMHATCSTEHIYYTIINLCIDIVEV